MQLAKLGKAHVENPVPHIRVGYQATRTMSISVPYTPKNPKKAVLQYLQHAIRRNNRTQKNFGLPTANSNRLFRTRYDHPLSANSCDGCLAEWEETRDEREDNDPQPHYGIIACGNSVIKHGETWEQLSSETGALCFEMRW